MGELGVCAQFEGLVGVLGVTVRDDALLTLKVCVVTRHSDLMHPQTMIIINATIVQNLSGGKNWGVEMI
eukprot:SAG11_NODE_6302_length_1342_cov_1.155270_2_plen_69_part_00